MDQVRRARAGGRHARCSRWPVLGGVGRRRQPHAGDRRGGRARGGVGGVVDPAAIADADVVVNATPWACSDGALTDELPCEPGLLHEARSSST